MASYIERRKFLATLGGAAAWPLAARAQQGGRMRRIGVLMGYAESDREGRANFAAFQGGLQKLGWTEGRNIRIDARWAAADADLMQRFAKELVALQPDLILTQNTPITAPMLQLTRTIPIIFANVSDPVGNGFVASLARPGGNITGLASSSDDTSPKQLELVGTVVPSVSRIGLLGNPASPPYADVRKGAQTAAQKASLTLVTVEARNPQGIESAFAAFGKERVQAFMLAGDAVFFTQRRQIADLALKNRLPSIFPQREYAEAGGLMSYGENLSDFFRRAASFVDKIFKGATPGDLPIDQPTRFNLVINRKTADALGVTIPPQLYIFADEVIE